MVYDATGIVIGYPLRNIDEIVKCQFEYVRVTELLRNRGTSNTVG